MKRTWWNISIESSTSSQWHTKISLCWSSILFHVLQLKTVHSLLLSTHPFNYSNSSGGDEIQKQTFIKQSSENFCNYFFLILIRSRLHFAVVFFPLALTPSLLALPFHFLGRCSTEDFRSDNFLPFFNVEEVLFEFLDCAVFNFLLLFFPFFLSIVNSKWQDNKINDSRKK